MNMKTLIQFLILWAGVTLIVSSCSKTYYVCEPVAEEEDSRWPWDITAQWNQENVTFDFKITSNVDQLAVDLTTPSEDSLVAQISGGTATSLRYLQASSGNTNTILAQNQSIGSESYPLHELVIVYDEGADSGAAVYSVSENDSVTSEDYSGFIGFTFSSLDYSLALSEQILYNPDSTQTVALDGTIDIETTQLIAGDSISVSRSFPQTTTNIVLNPNGEYSRNTIEMIGNTEIETIADGSWEVTDTTENILTIIETDDSGETATLIINYSLESNTLTFSQDIDPCDGFTEDECFEQFELDFGLAEDSITELSLTSTIAFTKSSGKRRHIVSKQPAFWFGKTNYFIDP